MLYMCLSFLFLFDSAIWFLYCHTLYEYLLGYLSCTSQNSFFSFYFLVFSLYTFSYIYILLFQFEWRDVLPHRCGTGLRPTNVQDLAWEWAQVDQAPEVAKLAVATVFSEVESKSKTGPCLIYFFIFLNKVLCCCCCLVWKVILIFLCELNRIIVHFMKNCLQTFYYLYTLLLES